MKRNPWYRVPIRIGIQKYINVMRIEKVTQASGGKIEADTGTRRHA